MVADVSEKNGPRACNRLRCLSEVVVYLLRDLVMVVETKGQAGKAWCTVSW